MKNLLALIGLAVVLVGGLGWYLGWYQIGAEPAGPGHTNFNVNVNTGEIADDLKKAKKKIGEILSTDQKNSSVSPSPEKQVEGASSGLRFGTDGSTTIVLPPLPALPSFTPPEPINPTGPKIVVPPPPSFGSGAITRPYRNLVP